MTDVEMYAKNCIDSLIKNIIQLQTLLAEMEKTSSLLWEHLREIRKEAATP